MTWTKLGDEFPDAAGDLSDAAFRLHVEALAWSNRRLLDLTVPKADLRRFYFGDLDDAELYVNELLGAGWWTESTSCWYVGCRFPDWQRDRVQVEHKREMDALAQRRRRRHGLGDHELCLPGKCSGAPPDDTPTSVPDARADSGGDYGDDPGRDGTGQGLALEDDHYVTGGGDEKGRLDYVFGSAS